MAYKPVTVTQLNTYLKQIFDSEELLYNISVVGEISGYSNVRGTAYFTLKDEYSTLSCVCFNANDFCEFKNGDSVLIIGTPKYYTKGGKLNFNVVSIQRYGQSVLYERFLQLKAKLEESGYFSAEHKVSMPTNIKRIGVVSSEDGAVIQDIINVRTRRNPNIDIVLYPVKVQGENAEYEIANGIKVLDNYNVDVIIVARGGGSMEDLQPFNTEVVAEATFHCVKPIVSAVGHETDYTIIDFCSDMRAPTPSAAAELLCENIQDIKNNVLKLIMRLDNNVRYYLGKQLDNLQHNINALIEEYDYVRQNSKILFKNNIMTYVKTIKNFIDLKEYDLKNKKGLLTKLNPLEVLKLGYACVKSNKGYLLSKNEVVVNDNIDIILKDGQIVAKVIGVK